MEVYAVSKSQMSDWKSICRAFTKKFGAELLFVNETSCGVKFKDGSYRHIYIDEMMYFLNKGGLKK